MSYSVSRFQGGLSGTTYICGLCGKRTRETGFGESSCDLCKRCYIQAGNENEHLDNDITTLPNHDKADCPECVGKYWYE